MFNNPINIQNRIGPCRGIAEPLSANRSRLSCRQQFLDRPLTASLQQPSLVHRTRSFFFPVQQAIPKIRIESNSILSRMRASGVVQAITDPWQQVQDFFADDFFLLNKKYEKPNNVILFSNNDVVRYKNGRILKMWLDGKQGLNLNPAMQSTAAYPSIKEALQKKLILLDWDGLLPILHGKILNPDGKHFDKYVMGLSCPNFKNHKSSGTREEYCLSTPNLSPKMEIVKNLASLLLLGFALNTLITEQPEYIQKKSYKVQAHLKALLFNGFPRRNDLMYSLVYKRKMHFCIEENEKLQKHEVNVCCVFNIFRIKTSKGHEETRINLASVYPVGGINDIAFFLWKNDAKKNRTLSQTYEKKKFDILVKTLAKCSIFGFIRKIYPDLNNVTSLQAKFKKILRTTSLKFEQVMIWPRIK